MELSDSRRRSDSLESAGESLNFTAVPSGAMGTVRSVAFSRNFQVVR